MGRKKIIQTDNLTESTNINYSPSVYLRRIWSIRADKSYERHFLWSEDGQRIPDSDIHKESPSEDSAIYVALRTTEGKGVLYLSNKKRFVLEKDSLIFFPLNQPRKYNTISDHWIFTWYEFRIGHLPFDIEKLIDIPMSRGEQNTLRSLVTTQKKSPSIPTVHGYFSLLMTYWISEISETKRVISDIDKAIEYINTHLYEKLSVESLAKICGLSDRHFRSIFKNYTGISPSSFILNARMKSAAYLLISTNKILAEIAEIVGLENPYYLSKKFKEFYGESPGSYRKRNFGRHLD